MFPSGSANLAIDPHDCFWGGSGNFTLPWTIRRTSAVNSSVTKAIPVSPGSSGAKPSQRWRMNRSPGGATRTACPAPPIVWVANPSFLDHHAAAFWEFETTTATSATAIMDHEETRSDIRRL